MSAETHETLEAVVMLWWLFGFVVPLVIVPLGPPDVVREHCYEWVCRA